MAPCPLCMLGFSDPHSKEDWKRLANEKELQDKLDKLMEERRERYGPSTLYF